MVFFFLYKLTDDDTHFEPFMILVMYLSFFFKSYIYVYMYIYVTFLALICRYDAETRRRSSSPYRWMVTPIFLLHTPVSANTRGLTLLVTRVPTEQPCRRLAEAHFHPFHCVSGSHRQVSHSSSGRRISSRDQAPRSRCYLRFHTRCSTPPQ